MTDAAVLFLGELEYTNDFFFFFFTSSNPISSSIAPLEQLDAKCLAQGGTRESAPHPRCYVRLMESTRC